MDEEKELQDEEAEDRLLFEKFFDENVCEDQVEILTALGVSHNKLINRFKMRFNDPRDETQPSLELIGATFIKIYRAIIDFLIQQRESKSSYALNIADRVVIGFETADENDDDEKNGNFMVYINHLYKPKSNDDDIDRTLSSPELVTNWFSQEVKECVDELLTIAATSLRYLKAIDIALAIPQSVIACFCTVYDELVNVAKEKRREKNVYENEINFMNCFTIKAKEGENGIDEITFRPSIESKLDLKSDLEGSSKFE